MSPENELDEAIKWLLDNNLISMVWNTELEDITFFMPEDQKTIYDRQNTDEDPPMWEGSSLWSH